MSKIFKISGFVVLTVLKILKIKWQFFTKKDIDFLILYKFDFSG